MGVLIAIEGTDSSGKQTQSELLYKRLKDMGIKSRLISFPAYESDSSALVKMYLAGEFGNDPKDVNAYAASSFYALDRFATFRKDWGKDYDDGTVIIADRYVPSNLIHQASKIDDKAEKEKFIKWLDEFEYNILGLPRPDLVMFLDMPADTAAALMANRENKIDKSQNKDIHERNGEYLKKSYQNAKGIADSLEWNIVSCTDSSGNVRQISEISEDIYNRVSAIIK